MTGESLGFLELEVDKHHSEIRLLIMHVELCMKVRYFTNYSGVGYCGLLIEDVHGKGLKGMIEAAAAKTYIGRTIFVFLSKLENGKELITVPSLFEKQPTFNENIDLSNFDINTYFHNDFKKTLHEVYKEHIDALIGKKLSSDNEGLKNSILELPEKGIEILKSYR
jgi:hypothetical protein